MFHYVPDEIYKMMDDLESAFACVGVPYSKTQIKASITSLSTDNLMRVWARLTRIRRNQSKKVYSDEELSLYTGISVDKIEKCRRRKNADIKLTALIRSILINYPLSFSENYKPTAILPENNIDLRSMKEICNIIDNMIKVPKIIIVIDGDNVRYYSLLVNLIYGQKDVSVMAICVVSVDGNSHLLVAKKLLIASEFKKLSGAESIYCVTCPKMNQSVDHAITIICSALQFSLFKKLDAKDCSVFIMSKDTFANTLTSHFDSLNPAKFSSGSAAALLTHIVGAFKYTDCKNLSTFMQHLLFLVNEYENNLINARMLYEQIADLIGSVISKLDTYRIAENLVYSLTSVRVASINDYGQISFIQKNKDWLDATREWIFSKKLQYFHISEIDNHRTIPSDAKAILSIRNWNDLLTLCPKISEYLGVKVTELPDGETYLVCDYGTSSSF